MRGFSGTPDRIAVCGAVALLVAFATACEPVRESDGRPLVAVSVPPLAYFVQELAGEAVNVQIMVPPGASPHLWEPTLEQIRAANAAALYIEVGHPHFAFEQTWLRRLIEANKDVRIVDCFTGVEDLHEDPHLWVSPVAARTFAPRIASALKEILPAAAAEISTREAKLLSTIDELDADVRRALAPARGGRFYVFHPAWGYLARDYGLVQVSIEHGSKEPSAAELAALIRRAHDDGADVVFVQPQFSVRSARVIAEEIGARLETLDPLSGDWPSAVRGAAFAIAASIAHTRDR